MLKYMQYGRKLSNSPYLERKCSCFEVRYTYLRENESLLKLIFPGNRAVTLKYSFFFICLPYQIHDIGCILHTLHYKCFLYIDFFRPSAQWDL